ncbi:hypothetical protein GUITHDRAFT_132668 [Guillardia theta CCMP2712]|uniref:Uncharacterized protein n=1 Tax=Guillardia theta (strain CCMP2712) TaxID=905079 RepID=L1JZK6_GUITC|nr:hypothetical protein GUITHDRAFT_132667 [Guillardia theta CCMP2712]XP_005840533.1 hypothetical protein GUITHDRAFT_132668 [Guillardia theta CCMP2712]EKX53552.1 hypothetical protein GUITHDRAFT_132667 [Guillardia theta CCMP2712]EKX53553.1 hypothetical protein GUITHDRAFT_132668 [Guillardia theta CCMP2712]|eukprot:XP_005840532.1 hypothetical protein GUITHDRAFT_132667 [Guillardia theta CCMP2712]
MLRSAALAALVASAASFSLSPSLDGASLKLRQHSHMPCPPATANAILGSSKGQDSNWELRTGGIVVTDVSGRNGSRSSAFKKSLLAPQRASANFGRRGLSEEEIDTVASLTDKVIRDSIIRKKAYETDNRVGFNTVKGNKPAASVLDAS